MYSPSIYAIVQADPSLIQLSILKRISWKESSRSSLKPVTVLVVDLK